MKVAVFGDSSGDIQSINDFCVELDKKSDPQIDLVLQTGDFTIPEIENQYIDKNIIKSYYDFLCGTREIKYPVLFIKGHSEDFDLLYSKEDQYIDSNRSIFYLSNGYIFEFEKKGEKLIVGALGGNRSGTRNRGGDTIGKDKYFNIKELKGNRRRHFTKFEIERLVSQKKKIDILLLHDSPLGLGKMRIPNFDEKGNPLPTGSKEVTELIEVLQPEIAVFGHYNNYSGIHQIKKTTVIGLNSLRNKNKSVLILNTDTWGFDVVDIN